MLKLLAPALFASLLTGAFLTSEASPVQDGPTPVAGAVHLLADGRGGNVGFSVGADGVLIVDDKFDNTIPSMEAALEALDGGAAKFLVNTHHHGDHAGGNAHFGKTLTILAHDNVRVRLEAEGKPAEALPVITYPERAALHFNGERIELLHYPNGHTDGDTVVWFRDSNVLHMGDLYFQVGFPYIDVGSGGTPRGMLAAIDAVLAFAPEEVRVIPGHGVVTGLEELRVYRDMLETMIERVEELHAEGFSVEEMLEAGVAEDYAERWTWGFIDAKRFCEILTSVLGD